MPAAIGAAILGADLAGTALIGSGAHALLLGTLVGNVVITGALAGASYALQALNQPDAKKAEAGKVTIKQSRPDRMRGYGRAKIGGALAFLEANGPDLYQVVLHCQGEVDAFEQWWLNDKNTGISSGSLAGFNGASPWLTHIYIESHKGLDAQAASGLMSASFPGTWTSDHRLRGIAYSVVKYILPVPDKDFQKFFPNGAPSLRVVMRLVKVVDPRDSTTAWTSLAGPCIMDFLTHTDGMGLSSSVIDMASFAAFTNLCAEVLTTIQSPGSELRYALGGLYDLTEERRSVLRRMLASCDGELYLTPGGKIGIQGGKWVAPTVTLTADHILGYEYHNSGGALSSFNQLKISFVDPYNDFQLVEGDPWDDEDDQAIQGVVIQDFSLPMVQSHAQARRLAKIATHKSNPAHRLTIQTNMYGLHAFGERVITVQLPELSLNTTFLVTSFTINGDFTGCVIGLSSLTSEAYAWDETEEEGTPPAVAGSASVSVEPPEPEDVVSSSETVPGNRILVSSDPAVDAYASYWHLVGQYRADGATDWVDMAANGQWGAISDFVAGPETYEVRAALAGLGQRSDFVNAADVVFT